MNDYRITFTRENGTTGSDTFTAASEREARKDFGEVYRHGEGTITSVELIREDVPATKDQERAALEKIRGILAPLGPNSYLRTAFEGCLEDAENNIEDDAAYSMKARYEDTQEKLRAEIAEHQATRHALEDAQRVARDAQAVAYDMTEAAMEAAKKTIPVSLWNELYTIAKERRTEAQAAMEQAADTMAHYAECPQDIAFGQSVKRYKAQRERKEIAEQLMGQLEGIAPDGADF